MTALRAFAQQPMQYLSIALLLVLILLVSQTGTSQDAPIFPEKLAKYITSRIQSFGAPGMAVAVIDGGEISAQGFGDTGKSGQAVTLDTPFQLASVSKNMASLVVLQLVDEGKLDIDQAVVTYLPDFRINHPSYGDQITVRQLMDHTSGLRMIDGNRYHGIDNQDPDASAKRVAALRGAVPYAAPASAFQYSNANYHILGHLIEALEATPIETVLARRIFDPLGMTNSFAGLPPERLAAEIARGHAGWFGLARPNHTVPNRAGIAAGGVSSTAKDLAIYIRALMAKDPRIMPSALEASWADTGFEGYAFGWVRYRLGDTRVIEHDGLNPGFRARVMILPDEGKAALVLMNQEGAMDGSLPASITAHALGLDVDGADPMGNMALILWGTLAMVLAFALGAIAALRKLYRLKDSPWTYGKSVRLSAVLLPTLGLSTLAYALLFLIPASMGTTFSGIRLFFPDIGDMLTATVAIALIWGSVMPILFLKRPKP